MFLSSKSSFRANMGLKAVYCATLNYFSARKHKSAKHAQF